MSRSITSFCFKPKRCEIVDYEQRHLECIWPVPSVELLFLPHFTPSHRPHRNHDYKIIRLLSKGSYGVVYQAENSETGQQFAVKVLKKAKILENNLVDQVRREVDIERAVSHFHYIVSAYHFYQTKPHLFIVCEYIERGDLYKFCKKYGPLPFELCRIYIAQLALATEFIHEAGIIHRDIKPENVLVDKNYSLKLTDFGLSKWLPPGPRYRTYTVCGTENYIAPEVYSGHGYGHPADWWSLGQLSIFLHTNQMVDLRGSTIERCLEKLPFETEERKVKDLLGRLLRPNPANRLRSYRQITTVPYYHLFDFSPIENKQMDLRSVVERLLPSAIS